MHVCTYLRISLLHFESSVLRGHKSSQDLQNVDIPVDEPKSTDMAANHRALR